MIDSTAPQHHRSRHHLYSQIPTPRVITLNLRSLGAGLTPNRAKLAAYKRCLRRLSRRCDILLLQETNIPHDTNLTALHLIPGFQIYNNPPNTAILIRSSILELSQVNHVVICNGTIHALNVVPSGESSYFCSPWSVVNVYIQAGHTPAHRTTRVTQLRALGRCRLRISPGHILMGGDFNLVRIPEADTASRSHYTNAREARLFSAALLHLGVQEACQSSFTFFKPGEVCTASRLDRLYFSHSASDLTLMRAEARVLMHRSSYSDHRYGDLTDHRPVLLHFIPNNLESGTRFVIPKWIVQSAEYQENVRDTWNSIGPDPRGNPIRSLLRFKRILKEAALTYIRRSHDRLTSQGERLSVAICILRRHLQGDEPPAIRARYRHCPLVLELYNADIANPRDDMHQIRTFIADSITTSPALDSGVAGAWTTDRSRKGRPSCFLQRAKHTLPQSRQCISALETPDGTLCTSPADIASELKRAWSPIWDTASTDEITAESFLRDKFPTHSLDLPQHLSEKHIRQAILTSGSTSSGPDGIPFCAYRVFVDQATPLLFDTLMHFADGNMGNRSFNACLLFFLPKMAGSTDALQHRPIAVSNTDNRILANCIKSILAPTIDAVISPRQHAFLRGRSIEDCIHFFNDKFFSAKAADQQYYVLLVDFAKAFDSVSRVYLFKLLQHLDAPQWLLNVLQALYNNIQASPVTGGKHSTTIHMLDGLKQGCPLSPLLFLLVIDPLLQDLNTSVSQDHEGFADDIAIGLQELAHQLPRCLEALSAFSTATGIATNPSKTVLIPAHTSNPPSLDHLPETWQRIRISHHERYLGTYLGREVTVHSVWENAFSKLQVRVNRFLPKKKSFTIQGRIDIANTFLVSLFSYLFRFYTMTEAYTKALEQMLVRWIVPYRMCGYDDLTRLPKLGGFCRPLKRLLALNVATILRHSQETLYQIPLDMSSLEMRIHKQAAACMYETWTGQAHPAAAPQRTLYSNLILADDTAKLSLCKKLARKLQCTAIDADAMVERIGTNLHKLYTHRPRQPPSFWRAHAFLLIHNGIPTRTRLPYMHDDLTCLLCNRDRDNLTHLHTQCPVAIKAKHIIVSRSTPLEREAATHLLIASSEEYLLRSPDADLPALCLIFLFLFSIAICRVSGFYRLAGRPAHSPVHASWEIATLFRSLFRAHTQSRSRVQKKKARAQARVAALDRILDEMGDHIQVATDGSALTNPGDAGAGIMIRKVEDGAVTSIWHKSVSLGYGTNNFAELQGIIHASLYLLSSPPPRALPIVFLVDNVMALRVAARQQASHAYPELGERLQRLTLALESTHQVHYEWTPGHAGWEINELADQLAKRGAAGITSTAALQPRLSSNPLYQDGADDHSFAGDEVEPDPRPSGSGHTQPPQAKRPCTRSPSRTQHEAQIARYSPLQPPRPSPDRSRSKRRRRHGNQARRRRRSPEPQSPDTSNDPSSISLKRRSSRPKRRRRSSLFPGIDFSLHLSSAPPLTSSSHPPHPAQPPGSVSPPAAPPRPTESNFSNLLNWIESFTPPS